MHLLTLAVRVIAVLGEVSLDLAMLAYVVLCTDIPSEVVMWGVSSDHTF